MGVSTRYAKAFGAVIAATFASAAAAAAAHAGPTPVSPPPPSHHCCQHGHGPQVRAPSIRIGGPSVHIGGPRINIGGIYLNNQVNVNVNAQASAMAFAGAQASSNTIVYGGGGFISRGAAPAATAIAGLALADEYEMEEESYSRMVEGWRVVRAVCIDDRGTPHPASRPERDERVREGFEGEIFRCMAGTTLQATLGHRLESGDDSFEDGQVIQCQRGDALRYGRGGEVFCAPAEAMRDCNERSLLRLYGPGVRLVYVRFEERYTAMRERRSARRTATSLNLMLDGGVGGYH
ncbi:hypothetical protein AB6B38_02045 [Glycocaulis abyssi]|uniref:Uncharacterized protein n=1 Tax=Glycocaulis abyssi TaxID=1433403 RepID=A0ABV9ND03_9PROT